MSVKPLKTVETGHAGQLMAPDVRTRTHTPVDQMCWTLFWLTHMYMSLNMMVSGASDKKDSREEQEACVNKTKLCTEQR